jgi:crotonobetainyl-CoA:carnitine CoA-transferase CaiB-like acyl-CoA transferase
VTKKRAGDAATAIPVWTRTARTGGQDGSAGVATAALAGLRVIDAATLAAAPMVATTLAEFGAEVIKVELPGCGDPLRQWGAQKDGVGLMWKSVGRNKKTVTLDLRQARGQEVLRDLAAVADVVILNTRPSTLRRWSLTYEDFRAVNESIIMLHITGFGAGGPDSDRPGFGTLGEAMSGFANLTGQPDGPPTLPPFMLADGVASLAATAAVMMALYHRDINDGHGQLVDINLIEPLARLLEHTVLAYDQFGTIAKRIGNRWDVSVPRNTYRTSDEKWIAMSGSSPTVALRVFRAIDRPDLAEHADYSDAQRRLQHADAIDTMVAEWVATKTLAEAMDVFAKYEVAAAPVYDAAELLTDAHLAARHTYVRLPDPDVGSMTVQAPVARLSATPGAVTHLGKSVGADNDVVYGDLLGYTAAAIADLRASGII